MDMIKSWRKFFESENNVYLSSVLIDDEKETIEENIDEFFSDAFLSDKFNVGLSDDCEFFTEKDGEMEKIESQYRQSVPYLKIGETYIKTFEVLVGWLPNGGNISTDDLTDMMSGIHRLNVKYDLFYSYGLHSYGNLEDISPYEIFVKNDNIFINVEERPYKMDCIYLYYKLGEVEVTELNLAQYYSWGSYLLDEGKLYIDVDKDFLISCFIESKSRYIKILEGDNEDFYYYHNDYSPKVDELSGNYSDLSFENQVRIVEIVLNKFGGLDDFKKSTDWYPQSIDGMSIDEFFKYLNDRSSKDRWVLLGQIYKIAKESEISDGTFDEMFDEICILIGDWTCSAHEQKNYEEINEAFWDVVDEHISYTKYTKKIKKSSGTKDNVVEWESEEERFKVRFNSEWIEDPSLDLNEENLDSIFAEWVYETIGKTDLNPRFSDYGHVDRVSMNSEISDILDRYSKK